MATEAETAAVARAVTKRYANGVLALDQLDLNIGRASITALIGNNGSGKTTFLKILAGLLTPDSGRSAATPPREPPGYARGSVTSLRPSSWTRR
jgi:ABC-type multidrug transport system ATPase subunit